MTDPTLDLTDPKLDLHDPTDAPVLQVDDLEFAYGRLQVLFGISLEVRGGEALALLGTNGAGKSTLLRVVAGLEPPSAGRVRFQGDDITGEPAERVVRRGLVLVSGGRTVFRDMTVSDNLDVQSRLLRGQPALAAERREEVLEVFPRLRDRLGHLAGSLSGGEQQQLTLAKALLLDPALLCIDELSLGLAPVAVELLLNTLQTIRERGVTLLLVEQSLNIAAALCPRAVFLEKGEVRFEGRTSELLERDDIARAVFLGGAAVDEAPKARQAVAKSATAKKTTGGSRRRKVVDA
jgi:ABC-type branched-subunit amino acid transport system ATPase component